jgi:hypothetical protein
MQLGGHGLFDGLGGRYWHYWSAHHCRGRRRVFLASRKADYNWNE